MMADGLGIQVNGRLAMRQQSQPPSGAAVADRAARADHAALRRDQIRM